VPLAFGDHGVMSAHFVPPGKLVRVPARIRYTRPGEHIFYRAPRARYPQICEHLTASTDFTGNTSSWGNSLISARARGSSGPGGPADWVATDTSHHLEVVAAAVWEYLRAVKLGEGFLLPEPEPRPWLQPALL
jgi:hypothetical protein